jgi:hypothetical protein
VDGGPIRGEWFVGEDGKASPGGGGESLGIEGRALPLVVEAREMCFAVEDISP